MSPLVVDRDKCKRDALCAAVCPLGLIEIEPVGSYPTWIEDAEDLCINCGHCVCVCPGAAITVSAMAPEQCGVLRKDLALSYEQLDHFLRSRRSTRNFTGRPVEREVLSSLLETASFAPSGHNLQPVYWLSINGQDKVRRLAALVIDWMREVMAKDPKVAESFHFNRVVAAWERGRDRVLREAPHLLVAHADASVRVAHAACIIALTHLELAATARGLGVCWAGYFNAAAESYRPLIHALEIPTNHRTFGALMIGHRKYQYVRVPRRNEPRVRWR